MISLTKPLVPWCQLARCSLEFSLYESLAFSTQRFRPLAAAKASKVGNSSASFREYLIKSKWCEYLTRAHKYKSGDQLPDVLACGGSAKQCIASGLAMGMTVPVPGFFFLGGLGGAIVATPPVQAAVARYICDNLACRLTVREDAQFGDLLLVAEINHMASKWRTEEIYSFKAGDFEIASHDTSFNGEQLRITRRVEAKGRVCLVEELYVLDRQGRGFDIRQRVMSGPTCVAETNRYYEYCEGSVLSRKSLDTFVPSERAGVEQFEWVEQNVESWLDEHQDEVLAESKALAMKAAENKELVESSKQLAALAETLVNGTTSFEEIKLKMDAVDANSTIDVRDAMTMGETLLYELANQTNQMQDGEKDEVMSKASGVMKSMQELADESDVLQKALSHGMDAAEQRKNEGLDDLGKDTGDIRADQLRRQGLRLVNDGRAIAASVQSAEDIPALLKKNPQFVEDIKVLVATYVEDSVCGIELPRIEGDKDWGTYAITGVGIKRFTVDPDKLVVDIAEGIVISTTGIDTEFDTFAFEVDKKTFPKVTDIGKATGSADISARISFTVCLASTRFKRVH